MRTSYLSEEKAGDQIPCSRTPKMSLTPMLKHLNEKDTLTVISVGSRFLSQVPEPQGRDWGKKVPPIIGE